MSLFDAMNRRQARKISMAELAEIQVREDLEFWMSRTPEERVCGIEDLRRTFYGTQITQNRTESRFSGFYPASKRKFG